MTTKKTLILALTLLTAGALATSCSNEDNISDGPQQQPANGTITLTATLAPKGGASRDQSGTRSGSGEAQPALGEAKGDSGGQTRSVDESGATAWVSGEKLAVYYQKTDDTYATATATVGEPNTDGSAPITASLSDAKGGTAKFVYPATLSDGAGGIDASILGGQDGTIAGISADFDAATGEGTITVGSSEASVSGTVTMTNQVLIGKFTPMYGGAAIDGITSLVISDGTNMYAVAPSSGTSFGTTGIYVAMLPVSGKKVSIWAYTASTTYIFKKSVTLEAGKLYRNLAIPCYPETVSLSSVTTTSGGVTDVSGTPTLRLQDGQLVTGSLVRNGDTDTDHRVKVTIADGATVTLSGATIDGKAESDDAWAGITCEGDATILLTGANTVTNFDSWYPAIFVPEGKTLTIGGSGTLTASNTRYIDGNVYTGSGAAIGGGYNMACGNIAITGGTVTANGGNGCAAIGGGYGASCGSITISGAASVTAKASNSGAGIGGGNGTSCGNISISGDCTVTATGGNNGAGIGSGRKATCGNISISGACTVTATGGNNGAGIGSGKKATCGNISISGDCTVTATGGNNGAGIGTGHYATCGSISITGGTVTAQGSGSAAGIGCGMGGSNSNKSVCGAITIEGSGDFNIVTAIRGQGALRPIGHSTDSNRNTCGTITFGYNTVYTAGDDLYSYSTDGGGLNFEETETDLGGGENYTGNTWKLWR